MSARFSRKEFIVFNHIAFPTLRQALIVSGFFVIAAILFYWFPPENYPQTADKWYMLGALIFCVLLIWSLFWRKRHPSPYKHCPNCNGKIQIGYRNGEASPGVGLNLDLAKPPKNHVTFKDGLCPHCHQTVWNDTPNSEFQGKKIPMSELERIQHPQNTRDIDWRLMLIAIAFIPILTGTAMLLFELIKRYDFPHIPGSCLVISSIMFLMYGWSRLVIKYSKMLHCPACGIKWFDFDFAYRTGHCHCCGELVVDLAAEEPATSADTEAEAISAEIALSMADFLPIPSKEVLQEKLSHFYEYDAKRIVIRDEMEALSDGELLALVNFSGVRDCVLESAFLVLKHRECWAEKLMFAYRNGLLTRRDAKMYMLHYVNVRGNQYPTDLAFYMELLNDKSQDIVGEALCAVTFFSNPAVIPQLAEMRDTRWKSIPKKPNQRFSMADYFSLSIAALKCGNPYIAYPFHKDCDNRWGFLAQWEKWSQLGRQQKDAIITQALAEAETEAKP